MYPLKSLPDHKIYYNIHIGLFWIPLWQQQSVKLEKVALQYVCSQDVIFKTFFYLKKPSVSAYYFPTLLVRLNQKDLGPSDYTELYLPEFWQLLIT